MSCLIDCECGRRVSGEDEPELLEAMRRHIEAEHPPLAGAPCDRDLLAMAVRDDD